MNKTTTFWKIFGKYLLVGLSIMMLLVGSAQTNLLQRGPDAVLADEEDYGEVGPGNNGYDTGFIPLEPEQPAPVEQPVYIPEPAPAPVAPDPAPSCSGPELEYKQCTGCNESEPVYQNSCGEYSTGSKQHNAGCASWCAQGAPAPQPQPQPGPSCTPNDQIDTVQDCQGNQWCTFNIWRGTDCSTGRGGAYGCQHVPGRCGYNQPITPVTPTQVCTPNQFDGNMCRRCAGDGSFWGTPGSDYGPNHGAADWCSCAQKYNPSLHNQACQAAPTYPTPHAPSCPADSKTCSDGSVVVRNPGAGCAFYACPVTPAPVCNNTTDQEASCVGQQYCISNVVRDCHNNIVSRNQVSCQHVAGRCGYNPTPACTPNGSCSAPAPSCGQTTTGVDNCNKSCSRTGAACAAPVQPVQPITITTNPVQTVTQTVTVPGGTTTTREVIREVARTGNVGVGTSAATTYYYATKELPKTGLPLLAYGAAAFIPVGFRFRRFGKAKEDSSAKASFIWEDRQFKGDLDSN